MRRFAVMFAGVVLASSGVALFVASGVGAGPLVALMVGLSGTLAVTLALVGTVVVAALLAASWLAGVAPGVGTLVSLVLYAPLLAAVLWLLERLGVASPSSWLVAVALWLAGAVLLAVGSALTIAAQLGVGPHDAAALALARHSRLSVAAARFALDVVFVVVAVLLSGPVGVGTVARAVVVPPLLGITLPSAARLAGTTSLRP